MTSGSQKLYDFLTKEGYDLGGEEVFATKIKNPESRKKLFNFITGEGYDLGDYNTYENKVFEKEPSLLHKAGEKVAGLLRRGEETSPAGAPKEGRLVDASRGDVGLQWTHPLTGEPSLRAKKPSDITWGDIKLKGVALEKAGAELEKRQKDIQQSGQTRDVLPEIKQYNQSVNEYNKQLGELKDIEKKVKTKELKPATEIPIDKETRDLQTLQFTNSFMENLYGKEELKAMQDRDEKMTRIAKGVTDTLIWYSGMKVAGMALTTPLPFIKTAVSGSIKAGVLATPARIGALSYLINDSVKLALGEREKGTPAQETLNMAIGAGTMAASFAALDAISQWAVFKAIPGIKSMIQQSKRKVVTDVSFPKTIRFTVDDLRLLTRAEGKPDPVREEIIKQLSPAERIQLFKDIRKTGGADVKLPATITRKIEMSPFWKFLYKVAGKKPIPTFTSVDIQGRAEISKVIKALPYKGQAAAPTVAPTAPKPPETALKATIEKTGAEYLGIQKAPGMEDMALFNDPITHTTRALPVSEVTEQAVKGKLTPKAEVKAKDEKQRETKFFQKLTYKRKPAGEGVVVGRRDYGWQLKKRADPLWAKDLNSKEFVSEVLWTKTKGQTVYIPGKNLKKGHIIQIYERNSHEFYKVLDVSNHNVKWQKLSTEQATAELSAKGIKFEIKKPVVNVETLIATGKTEAINMVELEVGDKFTIDATEYTVKQKGDDFAVIENGQTIRLPDFQSFDIDKGSYRTAAHPELTPEVREVWKPPTPEQVKTMELLTKAKGVIKSVANTFRGRGAEMAELEAVGTEAALKAAKTFNPSKATFITHSYPFIRGAISNFMWDMSEKGVRLPDEKRKGISKIRQFENKYFQEAGNYPDTEQIARALGMTDAKVNELIALRERRFISFETPTAEDMLAPAERIPEYVPEPDVRKSNIAAAKKRLAVLTDRERQVVELRTGFRTGVSLSPSEIVNALGITKQRVSYLLDSATKKLENAVKTPAGLTRQESKAVAMSQIQMDFDGARGALISDSVDKAYGSEEAAKKAEEIVLKDMKELGDFNQARIDQISKGLHTGEIKWKGTVVDTIKKAASWFSLFRTPKMEKLSFLLLDENRQILTYQVYDSKSIAGVKAEKMLADLEEAIDKFSPAFVMQGHNHPSGKVLASDSDINLTKDVNALCEKKKTKFIGHILTDHKNYTHISGNGTQKIYDAPPGLADWSGVGEELKTADDAVKPVFNLVAETGRTMVMFLSTDNKFLAGEVFSKTMAESVAFPGEIARLKDKYAAARYLILTDKGNALELNEVYPEGLWNVVRVGKAGIVSAELPKVDTVDIKKEIMRVAEDTIPTKPVEECLPENIMNEIRAAGEEFEKIAKGEKKPVLANITRVAHAFHDWVFTFGELRRTDFVFWQKMMNNFQKRNAAVEKAISAIDGIMKDVNITSDEDVMLSLVFEDKSLLPAKHLKDIYEKFAGLNKLIEDESLRMGIIRRSFQDRMIEENLIKIEEIRLERVHPEKSKVIQNLLDENEKLEKMRYLPHSSVAEAAISAKMRTLDGEERKNYISRLSGLSSKFRKRKGKKFLREYLTSGVLKSEEAGIIKLTTENLMSFYRRAAMSDLYKYAKETGAIAKHTEELKKQGWYGASELGITAIELKGYLISPPFANALREVAEMKKGTQAGFVRHWYGMVKASQFIKPSIVWIYDAMQALYTGVAVGTKTMMRSMGMAFHDVLSQTPRYHELAGMGLFQFISEMPRALTDEKIKMATRKHLENVPGVVKKLESITGMSWAKGDINAEDLLMMGVRVMSNATWIGDQVIRTITVNNLESMGYPTPEAVTIAARGHAAYSELSHKYKKFFGPLLFVHTFRVLMPMQMTKILADPIAGLLEMKGMVMKEGLLKSLLYTPETSAPPKAKYRRWATAIALSVIVPYALDAYLRARGYEKDKWMWKWRKKISRGEIVLSFNFILNMPAKAWHRLTWYNPIDPTYRGIQGLKNFMQWEIHPASRIFFWDILKNRRSFGVGEYVYDPSETNFFKKTFEILKYSFGQGFRLYGKMMDAADAGMLTTKEQEQNEKILAEGLDMLTKTLVSIGGYAYVRKNLYQRKDMMYSWLDMEYTRRENSILNKYSGKAATTRTRKMDEWYKKCEKWIRTEYR